MGSTAELIAVGVIVTVALAWAGRAIWRSVKKQGVCSSCGSSGECPIAGNPDALAELVQKGQSPHLDSCQPGTLSCHELADSLEKESSAKTP